MKVKQLQIVWTVLLAASLLSISFLGGISRAQAQSSRVWEAPKYMSNSGGATKPVLVVDSLGVRHAFWVEGLTGEEGLAGYRYSESKDGTEWTPPATVKFPFDEKSAVLPVFLSGPNGLTYIFWQDRNKSLIFARTASATFDLPSAWETAGVLSLKTLVYHVTMDGRGGIHVVYIRYADSLLGPAGIYYRRSLDGGNFWSDERLVYSSQYFRTTKLENAHVSVVASDDPGNGQVFVSWDNAAQKRIYMVASQDGGSNWSGIVQLKGPEDTGGYNLPYNIEMAIDGDKTLLVWKVGEPGATQCAVYSQWSSDWGATWSDPDTILDYRSICPLEIKFLLQQEGTIITLFKYAQGTPSIMAWNGSDWSDLQIQNEISLFVNTETHESIMFGCYNDSVYDGRLFLIGCDLGSSGDIWLTSRSILPVSEWLFPTSLWSLPSILTSTVEQISPLMYVPDQDYVHTLWMQSSVTGAADTNSKIVYSRWSSSNWSPAKDVMSGLHNISGEFSAAVNGQGRLLLIWSDERTGDLLFSWSSASKADSSSEWAVPIDLPSPSQWTSSPDMVVDASGRIVVVFAVPINEKRGVYLVESVDNGTTWSTPVMVFDAEAAGWIMVNNPKIALTGDGHLHVMFTNYSGLTNHPAELYYSHSSDGGTTWSSPDIVSDGSVVWSDIVSYDGLIIHRLWQQDKDLVVANFDQMSTDGGESWGSATAITGVSSNIMPVTIASNSHGELHLIQLVEEDAALYLKEYNLSIQDWRWNGEKWESQPFQELSIKGDSAKFSLAAGISTQGFLSVSLTASYRDLSGDTKSEIYTIGRSVGMTEAAGTPDTAILPTPTNEPVPVSPTEIQPVPSVEPTPFPDLSGNEPSAASKNLVGIILVLIVVGLVVFVFLRRAKKAG